MKPPILVGCALAILVVAAGVVAPALRSSSAKTAAQAQEQAELARRKLARVDLTLPRLAARADAAALSEHVDTAATSAEERLREINKEYSKLLADVRQTAEQHGLTPPEIAALAPTPAGARQGVQGFQEAVKANNELLEAAVKIAGEAGQTDGQALGVQQVLGAAQYVQAVGHMLEADELRVRQARRQADLLRSVDQWKMAESFADHFRGLDVAPILEQLHKDLDELAKMRTEAQAKVDELTKQVGERAQMLADTAAGGTPSVVQRMRDVREQLLALEKAGFVAGQDSDATDGRLGFDSYRDRYLKLSKELQQLEEQEQELRYGARRGAEFAGDDLATADISGGEMVVGLEELQGQLATATARADRLNTANASLENHIKYVTELGQTALSETQRFRARATELETEQEAIGKEILELAATAFEHEQKALKAARAAARSFNQSQAAVSAWVREQRDLQSERDPERKNDRLNNLLRNPYLEQFGQSAEAATYLLCGRICALDVESNQGLLRDLELYLKANPNPSLKVDMTGFQSSLDTARTEGLDLVSKAQSIYERLSKAAPETAWVPLSSLAAAYHLSARLDEADAAKWATQAAEAIGKAVEKREQNPYLKDCVQFRDHLGGGTPEPGTTPETPEKEPAETPEPTSTPANP